MTPGRPKLPAVTRCESLAAARGKNKDTKVMSDAEVIIFLLVCRDISGFTFLFSMELIFNVRHFYSKTLRIKLL